MRTRPARTRIAIAVATVTGVIAAAMVVAAPAAANHGTFPVSAGIYRIPYADSTTLTVSNDHHNHGSITPGQGNNRIDMVADATPTTVVAAASGVVMAIVDIHGDSNNLGDGLDVNGNSGQLLGDGVTVHTDAAEHSCQDASEDLDADGVLDPGEDLDGDGVLDTTIANSVVITICQNYNNYIWIEHPNGEWSKYTHMQTGSITGAPGNLSVGDTVLVGQALGVEADIGRASGRHLHHEVAVRTDPTDDTPFSSGSFVPGAIPGGGNEDPGGTGVMGYYAGGFIQGTNLVPFVCDIPGNFYADSTTSPGNDDFTADPCTNTAPTADAGGPYVVNEGAQIPLDGTGSSDPENAILSYSWAPAANLDDPTIANPMYSGVDDSVEALTLTVSDVGGDVTAATALTDEDDTTVTVVNVPPTVIATGDAIDEGQTATVSATFTDPGVLDTHTASIDWGYGLPLQPVTLAQLAGGVQHTYGDDGDFDVTVTVTDDDLGVGADTVTVSVANLDPVVDLDLSGQIAFPGGDFFVVSAGDELSLSAEGEDPGSDDLTFAWSTGDTTTVFNDGAAADPDPSPDGTFPFFAADDIEAVADQPAAQTLALTLSDDDGGSDVVDAGVIVTGTADDARSNGWWKHQYSGAGTPHVDAATGQAYLDIVDAVSSVFAEQTDASTPAAAHAVLSPSGGADARERATADLLRAWLHFASGAVAYDAVVPLDSGDAGFLDLMFAAEELILDPSATRAKLKEMERDLQRTMHAEQPS